MHISRVDGLVGGASEGQEIKVEFHEPEAIRSKRRRETLAIATPPPLESKKVVESGQNWYFDRGGCGFAQSIDFRRTMAKTVH